MAQPLEKALLSGGFILSRGWCAGRPGEGDCNQAGWGAIAERLDAVQRLTVGRPVVWQAALETSEKRQPRHTQSAVWSGEEVMVATEMACSPGCRNRRLALLARHCRGETQARLLFVSVTGEAALLLEFGVGGSWDDDGPGVERREKTVDEGVRRRCGDPMGM